MPNPAGAVGEKVATGNRKAPCSIDDTEIRFARGRSYGQKQSCLEEGVQAISPNIFCQGCWRQGQPRRIR